MKLTESEENYLEKDLKAYNDFVQFGRIRKIAKRIDPYSITFENNGELYVAISSGQTIRAEKFKHMSDDAINYWLKLLLNIRGIFTAT